MRETFSAFDRVPIVGVTGRFEKRRPLPRIEPYGSDRFERGATAADGHSTGRGSSARPADPRGRNDRHQRDDGAPARGDGRPGHGLAGRRAVRGGQPEPRLPGAQAGRHGRRDHAAHTQAARGHVLPGRARQALLAGRPRHGRRRPGGLRTRTLDQEDREGRRRARVRVAGPLARLAHGGGPRRGGRRPRRAAPQGHGVPVPVARRRLPRLSRRGPRAARGRGGGDRVRRGRVAAPRRVRGRRHRVIVVVEGASARPAREGRLRRQVRGLRRPRGSRPGHRRGLPGCGLAAPHRPPGARRGKLVPQEGGQGRRHGGHEGRLRRARPAPPIARPPSG